MIHRDVKKAHAATIRALPDDLLAWIGEEISRERKKRRLRTRERRAEKRAKSSDER